MAALAPTNGRGILNEGNAVRPTIVWPSVCVTTVLAAIFFGLPGTLAVPAMLATSLLAVRPFIAGAKVRRLLCVIAGVLATWAAVLPIAGGIPHVSVSSRSPDGTVVTDVYETDSFVDRHFQVRLTRYWLGIIPIRRAVYSSPDEGARGGAATMARPTGASPPVTGRPTSRSRMRAGAARFAATRRGVDLNGKHDDCTLAPTAVIASIPFAPELAIPATLEMHRRYGQYIYSKYGFFDAFNRTFAFDVPLRHGRRIPDFGWVAGDYLGIDQGAMLAMIENYRSALIWRVMRKNPYTATRPRAGRLLRWVAHRPRSIGLGSPAPGRRPRRRCGAVARKGLRLVSISRH
jgi:hypothetical protein